MAGTLAKERSGGHTATRLASGAVLVVGGYELAGWELARAELYDPTTASWGLAAVASGRREHTATPLASGHVLVAGGFHTSFTQRETLFLSTAELFDPGAQ